MKVIGVGDNVVDQYLYKRTMYPGGNALNFSVYAKQLGVESAYLGVFGSDRAAEHIAETLRTLEVDLSHCRYHEGENGYAQVDLVDGERVFIGGNGGGVQKEHPIILTDEDLEYIKTFEIAHSSIYSNMVEELQKLKAAGVMVSFDFSADYNYEILEITCKHVDVSLLSCGQLKEEEVEELLKRVHGLGSSLAIGTLGSRGSIVYDGQSFYRHKPHFVQPVDTLGAGDSFFTAFILHYLKGKKENQARGDAELIVSSLEEGAKFAAKTCLVDGAFGFGISF
ncbi:fructoselysine 6-kinase [Bacillus sp. MUM 116]|uniref:PfkB family carbohydrate kinase n=1 Tax=Bacillus sp. MUM 116 TaxID=1678002 RepID=UPI0008F5DD7A|nr:PfkB family carbohydrate kinase [Bacillus sp. MUM 116]OIK15689.1 fructoselysine 6-kinase [Bacillus sp. MUM 116]